MARKLGTIDETTYCGRLGARIRAARLKKKIEVADAAESAGVNTSVWYDWETGRVDVPVSRLPAIAAALGCRVKQIIPD